MELARWGAPMVEEWEDTAFQSHWLGFPVKLNLTDACPAAPPAVVELRAGDQVLLIEASAGKVSILAAGEERAPDAAVSGTAFLLIALVTGRIGVAEAVERGLHIDGDHTAIARVFDG